MSYTALYRKFRPDNFNDVKGQDHIVTTLTNQIKANRIGHAYLFCGTRGTGKTSVAKILAKAVNCQHPVNGSPCNECEMCKAIQAGTSMNVIEIDAASNNGVDNIREIREEVAYPPTEGKYKVYIIDEVHMLSIGAFNALLKTLEEPPAYVIFILATTEAHKIPITILSRCQRYDFKRISLDTIAQHLGQLLEKEHIEAEDKALRYIAKSADGSMRDALSLLEQCISYRFGEKLTYEITLEVLGAVDTQVFYQLMQAIQNEQVADAISTIEEVIIQGRELSQFVTDFTWYLRNLLLIRISDDAQEVLDLSRENLEIMKEQAQAADAGGLIRYIRIFSELSNQLRYATQKRVMVEIAVVKLCKPQMEKDVLDLQERIRSLEHKLENGQFPVCAAPTADTSSRGDVQKEEPEVQEPRLLPAIPEEIREVVKNWMRICDKIPMPDSVYYQRAKLSIDEQNRLLLVFSQQDSVCYRMVEDGIQNGELTQIIAKEIGRQVTCVARLEETGVRQEQQLPDLRKVINMEIVEED